jgi:hypothetical protein
LRKRIQFVQEVVDSPKFRRRSAENSLDGTAGSKLRLISDVNIEIMMHRKKRMANIIIEGLKNPKRVQKTNSRVNLFKRAIQEKQA